MIDFPLTDLMDEAICMEWLEGHLYSDGFVYLHCSSHKRHLFREQGWFPAYRCRACDGYYTLLTGSVFAKSHQKPSKLILLLRGISKGESTAHLSRELHIDRKHLIDLHQRIQGNLFDSQPTDLMTGTHFEADELYQNAGKKHAASGSA